MAELGREGQALREAVEAARRERDAEVAEATRALEQRARDAEASRGVGGDVGSHAGQTPRNDKSSVL